MVYHGELHAKMNPVGQIKVELSQNGGAYVNNEKVESLDVSVNDLKLKFNDIIILRSGKKNYHLIKLLN